MEPSAVSWTSRRTRPDSMASSCSSTSRLRISKYSTMFMVCLLPLCALAYCIPHAQEVSVKTHMTLQRGRASILGPQGCSARRQEHETTDHQISGYLPGVRDGAAE